MLEILNYQCVLKNQGVVLVLDVPIQSGLPCILCVVANFHHK